MSLNLQPVNLFVPPLIHQQGIISPPTRDFAQLKPRCLPAFPLTGKRLRGTRYNQMSIGCSFVHMRVLVLRFANTVTYSQAQKLAFAPSALSPEGIYSSPNLWLDGLSSQLLRKLLRSCMLPTHGEVSSEPQPLLRRHQPAPKSQRVVVVAPEISGFD
jgi:hypothetical protein